MHSSNEHTGLVNEILSEAAHELANFLGEILPSFSGSKDWWNDYVLSNLTPIQLEWVQSSDQGNLHSLDLSALLRVLDANWYGLQQKVGLSKEHRNYVKEMQTIRNRWAHIPPEGYSTDDIYRDLDTTYRFSKVISAGESFQKKVYTAKNDVIKTNVEPSAPEANVSNALVQEKDSCLFSPGDLVQLKSDPSIQGAVISVTKGAHENRYQVFTNSEMKVFYESQISRVQLQPEKQNFVPIEEFLAYLTAQQISNPSLSSLYSLNAARIDFVPYQLRPVLKFIRSDRPRMLIADGVGVGKTIEAGLILREIQARRDVRSIMIICPKPLVAEKKWEMEMKRFEETFVPLNGSTLKYCLQELDMEGEWPETYQKCILPYSLLDEPLMFGTRQGQKQKIPGLISMDPPPKFDLIIVDEAHHIRHPSTYAHQVVNYLVSNAEAALFLTATPIQMGNEDLFVLLNLLRPDLVIDKETFAHMVEPNPFINTAVTSIRTQRENWQEDAISNLKEAAQTSWGNSIIKSNPEFNEIIKSLEDKEISPETRVRLITQTENLNSFSGLINRTRRRDIGNFTIRDPHTVEVSFTSFQQAIHDEILEIQAEKMSRIHGAGMIKFLLSTIRRQVSSCLFGLAPFLEDILSRHLEELEEFDEDEAFDMRLPTIEKDLETRIKELLKAIESLPPEDPKYIRLLEIIEQKQAASNNKIMIFSSFIHTLTYLFQKLSKESVRIGIISGATIDEERLNLRNRFALTKENPDAIDILLFSEVGSEGLDYQFCDCMINYDLPWNPMRIEQRIGRIDRNGQKSEKVTIYNFITPGTIDAEIYERCLVRIGVFDSSLGASEQILGEITHEIQSIVNDSSLTDAMRKEKLQQLSDNKIRLVQEEEALERTQLELFGISLPREQMEKDIDDATSIWLSPASLQRLILNYLKTRCGNSLDYLYGDKGLKTLRLNQDARNLLLADFRNLPRQKSPMYKTWEKYLMGSSAHTTVTFEAEIANSNHEALLLMPIHPFIKQAVSCTQLGKDMMTTLRVKSIEMPAGDYPFAIYQWRYGGLKEDLTFQPVTEHEILQANLFAFLNSGEELTMEESVLGIMDKDLLDQKHYKEWIKAREAHTEKSKANAEYKRESLSTSYKAQISLLETQLKSTDDEKIQRMRQAQINSAKLDYEKRLRKLELDMQKADIEASPIAYGIIRVEEDAYELK